MKTLARILATGLAAGTGSVAFTLGVQDGLVGQMLPLLLILLGQVAAGGFLGLISRSWAAVAIVTIAYVAGFVATGLNARPGADGGQLATLAAGDGLLAAVFVLALFCSVLSIGAATGVTVGLRRGLIHRRSRSMHSQPTMRVTEPASQIHRDVARV